MTFIVSLADGIEVVRQADQRQQPDRYRCVIAGLHATPALIARGGLEEGIAIGLSPLGSRALLGTRAGELANLALKGEDVLGRHITELHDRARACASWSDRFNVTDEILGRLLHVQAAVPWPLHESWRLLESSGGLMPVSEVAKRVGWSRRHLSDRFAREFGMSPKTAARAIRFGRVTARLRRSSGSDLAGAAAACGYFDQSHLVREFASLAGCTPSAWIAEEFPSFQDRGGVERDPHSATT